MARTTKKPSMKARAKLSKAKKASLKRHGKEHGVEHMQYMKRRMLMGDGVRVAHEKANKAV